MNQDFLRNKNYAGFSFLETIISVFLISIGMIAVIGLMLSSLRESMDSRDQVIATLLSQEGIELVRSIRDNNWVNDLDSFAGFPNISRKYCFIDAIDNSIHCGATSFVLKLGDEGNSTYQKIYNYNSGTNTKFQRRIEIKYDNDTEKNMVTVTSIVVWGDKTPTLLEKCISSNKCVYTKTTLGRWGGN